MQTAVSRRLAQESLITSITRRKVVQTVNGMARGYGSSTTATPLKSWPTRATSMAGSRLSELQVIIVSFTRRSPRRIADPSRVGRNSTRQVIDGSLSPSRQTSMAVWKLLQLAKITAFGAPSRRVREHGPDNG